jgi:hypothetical protein
MAVQLYSHLVATLYAFRKTLPLRFSNKELRNIEPTNVLICHREDLEPVVKNTQGALDYLRSMEVYITPSARRSQLSMLVAIWVVRNAYELSPTGRKRE